MTFIPSFLSSPFISVFPFPSHAHLLFEQPGLLHHASERPDLFLCDLLLRDLHLSAKLFQEHRRFILLIKYRVISTLIPSCAGVVSSAVVASLR